MQKLAGIFERPPESGIHWISYTDPDGHRRREKVGKLGAAVDLLARRKREVVSGEFIAPRATRVWSFRRLAEEAIKQKVLRLAPLTIATDRIRLGQLLTHCGGVRFDRLSPERIESVLAALKQSGLSNSTVNRYRSFISSVFTFAVKTNRIAANPVAKVQRFKENDARIRWLRPEEETKIRREIVRDDHEWEFELALNTGMRRGEQFSLRWRDCDLERGLLTVKGKTGQRHVRANKASVAALARLEAISGEKDFVIPDANSKRGAQRDWRQWFEKAVRDAGVRDFHWHDLRHTFASRLVMGGVDLRTVQELLGHKSIVMTMKYAHLSADHQKVAVEKMGKAAKSETNSKDRRREDLAVGSGPRPEAILASRR